jgi:hypothetical protein
VALIGFVCYNLAQAKYFDTLNYNVCAVMLLGTSKEKAKKSENVPSDSGGASLVAETGDAQA